MEIITANSNPKIKNINKLNKNASFRKEEQVFIGIPAEYPTELINELCVYFDKEKREEIIETYCAYSMSIRDDFNDDEYLILQGRKRFFDRTFEMKDMSLISKDINKL